VALTLASLGMAALVTGTPQVRGTIVFLTLGLGQLGVALALRSRRAHGVRLRERRLEQAVLAAVGLMLVAVWAPPVTALLHTTTLAPDQLGVVALVAVAPAALVHLVRRWAPVRS
jgi:Ca2+-transporting ATPase